MASGTIIDFVTNRAFQYFFSGIVLIGIAGSIVLTIWTPKNSLIALKGTPESCDVYISNVSSRSRYGYEAKSRKAELIFYLREHRRKFSLMENIGNDYGYKDYLKICSRLNKADSVSVWIKKSELDIWEPKVFQLETDHQTILSFEAVRFKERPLVPLLLVLGIVCIGLSIHQFRNPNFSLLNDV